VGLWVVAVDLFAQGERKVRNCTRRDEIGVRGGTFYAYPEGRLRCTRKDEIPAFRSVRGGTNRLQIGAFEEWRAVVLETFSVT